MGIMRIPSLRALRSSFSVESRHKDKKIRDVEIVECDGEGGFNISLPSDELLVYGNLKKEESGIRHFRRIISLGRSWSKTGSHKRPDGCEDSVDVNECPKSHSHESFSLTHHFYENPSNGSVQDEVARLVLSRLMSHDDAVLGSSLNDGHGNDVGVQQDRHCVPVFSNTDDDSVTLNTLHHQNKSFDDTLFDGIVDDTIVDTTNQDQPSPQTSVHSRFSSSDKKASVGDRFLPVFVITCCRMPSVKTAAPFTPGSGTVVWDDTVILSALSY